MTDEEWNHFEDMLCCNLPQHLVCDGIRFGFYPNLDRAGRFSILVSKDGFFLASSQDEDLRRRVFRKTEHWVFSQKMRKAARRLKKEERGRWERKTVHYFPMWPSTNALVRHLKANNKEIKFERSGKI